MIEDIYSKILYVIDKIHPIFTKLHLGNVHPTHLTKSPRIDCIVILVIKKKLVTELKHLFLFQIISSFPKFGLNTPNSWYSFNNSSVVYKT